jgi:hypothetical protein
MKVIIWNVHLERRSNGTRSVFRWIEGNLVREQEVRRCAVPGGLEPHSGIHEYREFSEARAQGASTDYLGLAALDPITTNLTFQYPLLRLDFQWQKERCVEKTKAPRPAFFLEARPPIP